MSVHQTRRPVRVQDRGEKPSGIELHPKPVQVVPNDAPEECRVAEQPGIRADISQQQFGQHGQAVSVPFRPAQHSAHLLRRSQQHIRGGVFG